MDKRDDSPVIATVPLNHPAPQKVHEILSQLHKMERGVIATMFNELAHGKEGLTAEFQWGQCVGFSAALFLTGNIDVYQQNELCAHALDLRKQRN